MAVRSTVEETALQLFMPWAMAHDMKEKISKRKGSKKTRESVSLLRTENDRVGNNNLVWAWAIWSTPKVKTCDPQTVMWKYFHHEVNLWMESWERGVKVCTFSCLKQHDYSPKMQEIECPFTLILWYRTNYSTNWCTSVSSCRCSADVWRWMCGLWGVELWSDRAKNCFIHGRRRPALTTPEAHLSTCALLLNSRQMTALGHTQPCSHHHRFATCTTPQQYISCTPFKGGWSRSLCRRPPTWPPGPAPFTRPASTSSAPSPWTFSTS